MFNTIRAACAAVAISLTTPALADGIILTISGDVAESGRGEAWVFELAELQALPSVSFETSTIWTEGTQKFEGVPLDALLSHVGASQGSIRAVALNDYAVMIPTEDAVEDGPIVAYMQDGAEMSVRDKGPLWIIYPFDDNESYKSEEYYSRSIWQLDRLEIVAEN
jgi:hypothetical protein